MVDTMKGKITAVCISDTKGVRKTPCPSGVFLENYGMANDAHAECGIKRQVSLLSVDSIEKMKSMGLNVGPGDFAENLTVDGHRALHPSAGDEACRRRRGDPRDLPDRQGLSHGLCDLQGSGQVHHAQGGGLRKGCEGGRNPDRRRGGDCDMKDREKRRTGP